MTAEEAANAANAMHPEIAIPMHYGSIVGSMSAAEKFRTLAKAAIEILTPQSPD